STACAAEVGAQVIAADVASDDQLEELRALGVAMIQGPIVGDPLTVAELSGNPPPTRFKTRDPDTESPNIEVSPPSTSLREAET
ncbi:MAG: EAL domain-containing protein, partial [Actinobacteria bacterium]